MSAPRFVLVLGMHRSGTSCLAGSLERCGVFLGEVGRSNKYNAKGNHELDTARVLNDRILERCGGSWSAPPERIAVTPDERQEMSTVVSHLASHTPCGLKDPRVLLTVDDWLDAIGDAALIGTYRHPEAVAQSLAHRNDMPADAAHALWLRYNRELLRLHARRPFPIVEFDLRDPGSYCATVSRLATDIDLKPDAARLWDFVSADLDHSDLTERDVPPVCREVWSELRALRVRPEASVGPPPTTPRADDPTAAQVMLVSGPTGCGKSTYIRRQLDRDAVVLMPDRGAAQSIQPGRLHLVHYDILRPYRKMRVTDPDTFSTRLQRLGRRLRSALNGPFAIDRRLREILASSARTEAVVLYAPRDELLQRVAQAPPSEDADFDRERLETLRRVDLAEAYVAWVRFLAEQGVPTTVLAAEEGDFTPMEAAALEALASSSQTS